MWPPVTGGGGVKNHEIRVALFMVAPELAIEPSSFISYRNDFKKIFLPSFMDMK